MDSPENSTVNTKHPKRNMLFLVGAIAGILVGALLTLFMVDWLDYRRPTEVRVVNSPVTGVTDTVVKYVVHRHETVDEARAYENAADSTQLDTAFTDDPSQDLYLDDDELADAEDEKVVMAEKMIARQMLKIQYLDNNKKEVPVPENAPAEIQFQQWETPVRNKLSYQLTGNLLRVKGMSAQNVRIVQYKGRLHIVRGHQVYILTPNTQFERLVEVVDSGL